MTYRQDLGIVATMAMLTATDNNGTVPPKQSKNNKNNTTTKRDRVTNQKYKAIQQKGRSRPRPNNNANLRRSHQIMQPRPGF